MAPPAVAFRKGSPITDSIISPGTDDPINPGQTTDTINPPRINDATSPGNKPDADVASAVAPTPPHPDPIIAEHARLRIHLEDLSHKATASFVTLIDLSTVIRNAINNVQKHLYTPYIREPQEVRSVTLILRSMDGVAYTTGTDLDETHKEIHLSLSYLADNISPSPSHFRAETIGVITHEMVHCFQLTCRGTAPGGLIEGMADYVRLRSGLAPPHWRKEPANADSRGTTWDAGYQKTAWFLEWIDARFGEGSVVRLNAYMHDREYDEEKFWKGLFGMTVGELWEAYKKTWDEGKDQQVVGTGNAVDDGAGQKEQKAEEGRINKETKAESSASSTTEPEMVDLSEEEKAEADGKTVEKAKVVGKKAQEFIA